MVEVVKDGDVGEFDIKRAKEEAEKEVQKEKFDAAKRQIKSKMHEIERAKKIVKNLENELKDLLLEVSE